MFHSENVVCRLPVDPSLLRPFFFLPASVQASSTWIPTPPPLPKSTSEYTETRSKTICKDMKTVHDIRPKQKNRHLHLRCFILFRRSLAHGSNLTSAPGFLWNTHPTSKIASSNIVSSIVSVVGVPSQSWIAFHMLFTPKDERRILGLWFFSQIWKATKNHATFQNSYRL